MVENGKPRRKQLTRGLAGLLAVGVLAAGWYGATEQPTQSAARASEDADARAHRYKHPSAGVYSLVLQTRVAAHGEGPLAEFRLTGELGLLQEDLNDAGLWRLAFEGDYETFDGRALPEDSAAALATELKQPWRIRFDPTGRVADVEVAAGLTPFTTQIWKSIAYSLQLVPATPPRDSWQTEERDTVGTYLAEYRHVAGDKAQSDEASVQKTKLRYLETEGGMSELKAQYHIEQAEQRFRFDAESRWLGLEQKEKLWIDGMGGLPGFASTSELRVAVLRGQDVSEFFAREAQQPAYESAFEPRQPRDLLGTARLSGLPWSEALARLHQLATTPDPDDAQQKQAARAYVALVEHLRLDATRVTLAEGAVLEGGPLTRTWVEALRDADTPESHAALTHLARAPSMKPRQRMLAVRALSHVHTPSRETVSALQSLDSDPRLGLQAVYGLGSNIYRLQEHDPGLANDAMAPLLSELEEAPDDSRQITLLVALGNAGHPAVLSHARARLAHPSDGVRAAALQAVRRVQDGAADLLLSGGLEDPSPRVRRSALDALSERDPEVGTVRSLMTVLSNEREPGVRAQALNLAIRWVGRAPALTEGLRQVAERDPIASLRQGAKRGLVTPSNR